jgi:hypothetical protein
MNEENEEQSPHLDDQSVLNFLLQNVRGLRPVSTADEFDLDDDISYS